MLALEHGGGLALGGFFLAWSGSDSGGGKEPSQACQARERGRAAGMPPRPTLIDFNSFDAAPRESSRRAPSHSMRGGTRSSSSSTSASSTGITRYSVAGNQPIHCLSHPN